MFVRILAMPTSLQIWAVFEASAIAWHRHSLRCEAEASTESILTNHAHLAWLIVFRSFAFEVSPKATPMADDNEVDIHLPFKSYSASLIKMICNVIEIELSL